MKKTFTLLLSTLLLAGCGTATGSSAATASSGGESAKSSLEAVKSTELTSYITKEAVTPENWENYFTAEVEHNVKLSAFDEDEGDYEEGVCLRIKDNYIAGDDLVMRFVVSAVTNSDYIDKDSGEIVEMPYNEPRKRENTVDVLGSNIGGYNNAYYMVDYVNAYHTNVYDRDNNGTMEYEAPHYTLNSLEMVKSKGNVILFDLPEEKWFTDEETGVKFFRVLNEETGIYMEYYMNGGVKALSSSGEVLSFNKPKKNTTELTINQLFRRWGLGSLLEEE